MLSPTTKPLGRTRSAKVTKGREREEGAKTALTKQTSNKFTDPSDKPE